ncbi:MAG: hypothetical protein HUJ28_12960 [Chromatiales bacterium]|nr:hypothetical protein [Chromatiales bacterium]
MSETAGLSLAAAYSGSEQQVRWAGNAVEDKDEFADYLRKVVAPRVTDSASGFAADLRALATTGMATEFVEHALKAVPKPKGWEVGEALAECVLETNGGREVRWPWNTARDRRTPRASLPGADLVGFCLEGDEVLLLFGEVKTSSDANTPPGVMSGGSGMIWQLEESASRLDIQLSLLQWLQARCKEQPYRDYYERAVSRYLASRGRELLLVGILVRDTSPSEQDLKARAKTLAKNLDAPMRGELIAWYLPIPIKEWADLLEEAAA